VPILNIWEPVQSPKLNFHVFGLFWSAGLEETDNILAKGGPELALAQAADAAPPGAGRTGGGTLPLESLTDVTWVYLNTENHIFMTHYKNNMISGFFHCMSCN
jgi:hypothetical protein